ncbi:MAG: shikimate kinase [Desulfitobacteriaceae bacterium]
MGPKRNIVLIGFMGTGKSTVGRRLAKALDWEFIDTDSEIEELTGLDIADLFRLHGERRFRSEEALLIKRLSDRKECVIATGGGAMLDPENRVLLTRNGLIISLYATVDTILQRVSSRPNARPLLKGSRESIEELWSVRQEVYARADLIIDTMDKDVDQVAGEILAHLEGEI